LAHSPHSESVRVNGQLLKRLRVLAEAEEMTLQGMIEQLIAEALAQRAYIKSFARNVKRPGGKDV
jgi:predicted transcriptional regulator